MSNEELATELTQIAKSLMDLANRVVPDGTAIAAVGAQATPEALRRAGEQKCLSCNKKPYLRGLCQACYQKSVRAIEEGKTTDYELIQNGLRLPARRGRPPENDTKLEAFLSGAVGELPQQAAIEAAVAGQQSGHCRNARKRKAKSGK